MMATITYEQWINLDLRIREAERRVKAHLQHYDEFPTDFDKPEELTQERLHELHREARTERICRDVMES
jgi:hypothetical protein